MWWKWKSSTYWIWSSSNCNNIILQNKIISLCTFVNSENGQMTQTWTFISLKEWSLMLIFYCFPNNANCSSHFQFNHLNRANYWTAVNLLITARKWSGEGYVFSHVCPSFSPQGVPMWPFITNNSLGLTVRPPPPTVPVHYRYGTAWNIKWPSLETCSNLFTWGSPAVLTSGGHRSTYRH